MCDHRRLIGKRRIPTLDARCMVIRAEGTERAALKYPFVTLVDEYGERSSCLTFSKGMFAGKLL